MFGILELIAGVLLLPAQDPYTLKIDVPVVSVDVVVSDAKGALVSNLTKTDFEIFEDGVAQDIRFFSPVSAPYNVFLLFDRSQSAQDNWPFMQKAVVRFIEGLRPQDRVALGSFDNSYDVHVPWTTDRSKITNALDKLASRREANGTRFYAALDRTLRHEFKKVAGRRAVVVLTDGKDTDYSWYDNNDLKKALKATEEARIPVYIVALEDPGEDRIALPHTREYLIEMREFMRQFTERSGGQMLFPKKLEDVLPMYEQIGRALGTSYSLGYVSATKAPAGRFRRVEVKARANGFRITQFRTGYVVQ